MDEKIIFNYKNLEIECVRLENEFSTKRNFIFIKNDKIFFEPTYETKLSSLKEKFFFSSVEDILQFILNYDLQQLKISYRALSNEKKNLIYLTTIYFSKKEIKLSYSIDYLEWKQNFTIKDFINNLHEIINKNLKNLTNLDKNILGRSFSINLLNIYSSESLFKLNTELVILIEKTLKEMEELFAPTKKFKYKIDKKIKTGIKQYIAYFNDYVEKTKGLCINFEIENYDEGLILKISNNQDIEKIEKYFEEYMNFLRYKEIDNIELSYEIEKDEYSKAIDLIEIKSEVRTLQQKCDTYQILLSNTEREKENYLKIINKMLDDNNDLKKQYTSILQSHFSNPQPLILNNTNTNTNTNININGKVEIEQLQSDINKIKQLLNCIQNEEIKSKVDEITEIDEEILEVDNIEELKEKKKFFKKFKRIIEEINDEDSILNKTIQAGKKGKEFLEKTKPFIPIIIANLDKLKALAGW